MRIGILTYHCVTNFGAQLQALSTIGYMRKNGHEPIILNWFPQDLEDFYLRQHPRCQFDEQFQFAMNVMPVSELCRTSDELYRQIDNLNLDAIFLGSDALFDYVPLKSRFRYNRRKLKKIPMHVTCNHDLPNPFWGSFNDNIKKKIPYSGFSISSQNMPYYDLSSEEKKELGRLLQNFSMITSRDEWTMEMIKNVSGRDDITITPDPVFAFNYNTNYNIKKEELLKKYNLPDNYILISFCKERLSDSFVNEVVAMVEAKTGSTGVSFPMPRGLKKFRTRKSIELPLPTLDWYYLIKYSQGYIGELMHPIIVCLHNSVPFFCFDQYGTSKRIIPFLWSEFIPESSKIYDILNRADMLQNMCSYKYVNKITPDNVVQRFFGFDKDKCSTFAEKQYTSYIKGMGKVMSSIM